MLQKTGVHHWLGMLPKLGSFHQTNAIEMRARMSTGKGPVSVMSFKD
jgi:hypothetical protein